MSTDSICQNLFQHKNYTKNLECEKKMKSKKSIVLLVALLFIITSTSAIIYAGDTKTQQSNIFDVMTQTKQFLQPQILEDNDFTTVSIPNVKSSTISMINKPLLPVERMVYEFPLGTVIDDVVVSYSEISSETITKPVQPTPIPEPYTITPRYERTVDIDYTYNGYDFTGYFPQSWFDYSIGVGLNSDNKQTVFLTVTIYPVRYSYQENMVQYISDVSVDVIYDDSNRIQPLANEYDLLIISAPAYLDELQPLVDHKEDRGIRTHLVSVNDIDGEGRDLAEKIKYFIQQTYEETGIQYVMLVGGHRGFFGFNRPALQIPTRYVYLDCGGEPGYVSDLYYADFYRYDASAGEIVFSCWDTNNNDKFGEWYGRNTPPVDIMDLYPDINFGRLAARTVKEVTIMVNKIINYENNDNKDWFEKIYVISGDDFQDQPLLDFQWDTTGLNGEYTIYAQSTNLQAETGPIKTVTVTVDHSKESEVTFSETDHLTTDLLYPHPPVAEITVPSEGNILGNTNVIDNEPPGAYIGERWTPIKYQNKIMYIRGKSYNPQNQITEGANTTITVWVKDSSDNTVYGPVSSESNVYFEGEWANQKALDYLPEDFEKIKLWSSIGTLRGTENDAHWGVDLVADHINEGAGFVFIAGHASPMVWANHYPGIPGGRSNGDILGLLTMDIGRSGRIIPSFPINKLNNGDKLPVMLLSGCSPCRIDANLLKIFTDGIMAFYRGYATFESLGWWITRLENGGTIATLGPAALGYGYIGEDATEGLGGWFWPEMIRHYAQENETILGNAFTQTLNSFITEFGPDLDQMGIINAKTVQEMIVLGDPTLVMG
jgi:hypothetical protein